MIPSDDQLHHDDSVVGIRNSNRVSRARLTEVVLGYLARNPKWVQIGIWSVVLGSTAVGIGLWIGDYLDITDVGYLATFYLNLVGAATIIMPLPGVLAACVAAEPSLGLHPMIIGFVGAVGATLGETTAYLVGFAGQNAAMKFRWYSRIHDLMERNGAVTLFAVSLIPTPFFDLAGIAAGALLYPYRKFLIYVFAGKLIRLIIMAYACRSGIEWLRDIFELNLPIG